MTEKSLEIQTNEMSELIKDEADMLMALVDRIDIIDDETDAKAKKMMSEISNTKKELKRQLDFLTLDFKEAVKKVSIPFKERSESLDKARKVLDGKVIAWDDIKREKIRKEELRLQKLEDKKEARRKEKLEKEAAEREISVEEVEAEKPIDFSPPKIVEQVKKTVKTDQGSVTIRRKRVGEVVDASLLPREYLKSVPDQAAIDSAVANGVTVIRGVKIWDKPITSARGR